MKHFKSWLLATALIGAVPAAAQYIPGGGGSVGGGSGTVTNVATGNGLTGGPITTTGTIATTVTNNPQTGTSYPIDATDGGKIILGSNGSAITYTLSQANQTGFTNGFGSSVFNANAVGGQNITINATTSTFANGSTSIVVRPGQNFDFASNSTNYPFGALSLPLMAADTILGNFSGSSGYGFPSAALTSCSGASNALTYNTTTHAFGCNTISGSGSPGGSDTQIQYNNAGSFGGISTFTNASGALTLSTAGAANTSALTLSGAPSTGGSTTTDFPLLSLWTTGATGPTTWSDNGTFIGLNAASGFTGNFFDAHLNGAASVASLNVDGTWTVSGINVTSGSTTIDDGLRLQSANTPCLYVNGGCKFQTSTSLTTSNQAIVDTNASGYQLATGAASSTAPTLVPRRTGNTTGWGAQAAGNISGIISGVERTRFTDEGVMPVQATAPTCTGTGTPSITTGSTDQAGQCTAGASATSVIITFNRTHTNVPFCVVTSETTIASFAYTVSTTAITVTQTATSGNLIDFVCMMRA